MLNNDADMIITNIKNGGYINIRYKNTGSALYVDMLMWVVEDRQQDGTL
jgi:hypothetical protein